jgi:DNA-binding transcriptional LysR family regulator
VVEAAATVLHRWVESGKISLGLVEAHVSRSVQLDLNSQDRLVVVSKTGRDMLAPGDVPLARLADLPLVLPSDTFGLRQLINRAAEEARVSIVPRIEVNSLAVVLAMVRRMPLATVMPETTVQPFVAEGAFQINTIVDPTIHRRLSIIFSTSRSLTEIERALVDTLRRHLA